MKLVVYILIVVVWILLSNYQRIQARKRKREGGIGTNDDRSRDASSRDHRMPEQDNSPESVGESNQKDLLEEIFSQWTTQQPTVEKKALPEPSPVTAHRPITRKKLTVVPVEVPFSYETVTPPEFDMNLQDEISSHEIAQTEGQIPAAAGQEFDLRTAVIYKALLKRPDY